MKSLVSPSDDRTTVAELKSLVESFVAERRWHKFHVPKNLSMALAVEAAELMEHFQWLTLEASEELARQPAQRGDVEDELADVVCYALALANAMEIDLSRAIAVKMRKNVEKHPPPTDRRTTARTPAASAGAEDEASRSTGADNATPDATSSPG